jgi:hypothetical protein
MKELELNKKYFYKSVQINNWWLIIKVIDICDINYVKIKILRTSKNVKGYKVGDRDTYPRYSNRKSTKWLEKLKEINDEKDDEELMAMVL